MRMILDIIYTCAVFYAMANMLNILEFIKGDRVRLVDFGRTNGTYRRKLMSLGMTRGVELAVVRVAPLGCPIQVEVRGTTLALRKEEACHLLWERA